MGAYEAHLDGILCRPGGAGERRLLPWADACTLQTALSLAFSGDEIWVQAGVHSPQAGPTDTFTLKNGVAVYGGFAGTETLLTQRDWNANLTTLSGDIGAAGIPATTPTT